MDEERKTARTTTYVPGDVPVTIHPGMSIEGRDYDIMERRSGFCGVGPRFYLIVTAPAGRGPDVTIDGVGKLCVPLGASYAVGDFASAYAFLLRACHGYFSVEIVGEEGPLSLGRDYTLRVRLGKSAPAYYTERPALVTDLPADLGVRVYCPGLTSQEGDTRLELVPGEGQEAATALFHVRATRSGAWALTARLFSGGERVSQMQIDLIVQETPGVDVPPARLDPPRYCQTV